MTGTCEYCGNQFDNVLTVIKDGREHIYDCFECAIHQLAPHCAECDTVIIGHGVEFEGQYYCCYHCASHNHDRAFSEADPGAVEHLNEHHH